MKGTAMARIRVNDVELYYEEHGAGDPLVMVHGNWVDHHSWDAVVPHLAKSFRVIAYDLRGHSRSERPPGPVMRRQNEDDLGGLIEALAAAPATIAANSYGTSTALGLAARRPELVRGVIGHEPPLVAVAMDNPGAAPALAETEATLRRVIEQIEGGDAEGGTRRFMEQVALGPGGWELLPEAMRFTAVANAPAFVAEEQASDWADLDLSALSRAAVPIQLTQGDQSPGWFSAIVAEITRSVEHVEVSTIEGAGHAPNLTHVREYVASVMEFAADGRTEPVSPPLSRESRVRGKGRPGAADPGLGRIAAQGRISTE
jgi:pimeloyl-ACP methyl ester carboxylesterase